MFRNFRLRVRASSHLFTPPCPTPPPKDCPPPWSWPLSQRQWEGALQTLCPARLCSRTLALKGLAVIGQKFLPSRLAPFCRSLDLFLGAKTSLWLPGQHCPKLVEWGSHRARGRSSVNVPRCGIKAPPRQAEVFP